MGWASSCKVKGRWFGSCSGHMPQLRVGPQSGSMREANPSMFLSLSFSLPSPLFKINKRKKLKKKMFTLPCWLGQIPGLSTSSVLAAAWNRDARKPPHRMPRKVCRWELKNRTSQERSPGHRARPHGDRNRAQGMGEANKLLGLGCLITLLQGGYRPSAITETQPHASLASTAPACPMNSGLIGEEFIGNPMSILCLLLTCYSRSPSGALHSSCLLCT